MALSADAEPLTPEERTQAVNQVRGPCQDIVCCICDITVWGKMMRKVKIMYVCVELLFRMFFVFDKYVVRAMSMDKGTWLSFYLCFLLT